MRSFYTPAVVAGVGTFLCILAVVLIFVLVIKPTKDQLASEQTAYAAVSQYTQQSVTSAQKDKVKAQQDLDETIAKWNYIQVHYNPNIDLVDRFKAWQELCQELEFTLGPDIDTFLTKNKSGAIRLGTVHLPAPPSDPNLVPFPIVKIPIALDPFPAPASTGVGGGGGGGGGNSSSGGFSSSGAGGGGGGGGGGGVSVIGTFDQDLSQVASWNNFNRIVKVDSVNLSGYSPFIVCGYNATIYEFTKDSDLLGAPLPTATGGSASGGAAGGPAPPGGPGAPGPPPAGPRR